MSPADVLPAVQQGTLDGAVFGVQLLSGLHFYDTAKYVTLTHHSGIFAVVEVSKKWYDSLPPDLQKVIDRDGAEQAVAINPQSIQILDDATKVWVERRRSTDYLAARGAGENAADHGQRRRRCREDQAGR